MIDAKSVFVPADPHDLGIEYKNSGSERNLIIFSDSHYAGNVGTRRSTTGYVSFLPNGAVTWSSQRQKMVTLSITEVEYAAEAAATREAMWLRRLLCYR